MVSARHPTRFRALATLPVSMPEEATIELDRCVRTLGFKDTVWAGIEVPHRHDNAY